MNPSRQLLWFGVVGVIGLVVDVAILTALQETAGVYIARLASFLGAASTTWILNRRFTFAGRTTGMSLSGEYFRYLGLMLGGGLVNLATYSILASQFSQTPLWLGAYVGIGSLLGMVVNFTGASKWLFRQKSCAPVTNNVYSFSQSPMGTTGTAPKTTATDLRWIQALRGVAALMVLFFHMHPHWDLLPALSNTSVLTRWGFSGVDIFFTLSGFVVYRSALRTIPASGVKPFALKRLRRIYLGYWPVLLLIGLTTVWVYDENLPSLQKMIFSTLLLYPNIWDNWLPPAWSLTMEIYFYLWIIPIALLPQRYQVKIIFLVMLVLATWGILWAIVDPQRVFDGHQPLRYGLTGLGLEFLAGALVAHVYDGGAKCFRTPISTVPLCLLLIVLSFLVGSLSPYFDRVEVMRAGTFGVVGLAALIIALSLEQTRFSPPIWLVLVGDASYSLYLLHTFLLDASGRIRMSLGISDPDSLLIFLLCLPVTIVAVSMLWFRCIEQPLLQTGR